ncbi:hypothetical protein V7O61_08370 [Methanolobus sp. WCC1]|jgi:DNA replicative helicase MCM subunit Mcm2 (Cdc46/Mcm family)|uniref:hypothetical protein n=1 Tax=unclassified Methanolobus TaxID=2629569 RepID=UPI003251555D
MDECTNTTDVLQVRDLRAEYIGKEVFIKGIVHDLDMIRPKLLTAAFVCKYCETEVTTGPWEDSVCENETCGRSDGLILSDEKSIYTNYLQMILAHIFEHGDSVKKYSISVDLEGDLVNGINEKDVVIVKGILNTTADKQGKVPKDLEYTLTATSIEILDKGEPSKNDTENKVTPKDAGETSQRKDIKKIKEIIKSVGEKHPGGKAPLKEVYAEANAQHQLDQKRTEDLISRMRRSGDLIKPDKEHVKVV